MAKRYIISAYDSEYGMEELNDDFCGTEYELKQEIARMCKEKKENDDFDWGNTSIKSIEKDGVYFHGYVQFYSHHYEVWAKLAKS